MLVTAQTTTAISSIRTPACTQDTYAKDAGLHLLMTVRVVLSCLGLEDSSPQQSHCYSASNPYANHEQKMIFNIANFRLGAKASLTRPPQKIALCVRSNSANIRNARKNFGLAVEKGQAAPSEKKVALVTFADATCQNRG